MKAKLHSLSFRLNSLILILVLILATGLVVSAYINNSRQVDDFYKRNTMEAAATLAEFLDGNLVERLGQTWRTEEYQLLRDTADTAEDDAPIEAYLKEKGLWEDVMSLWNQLQRYRELQGAKYVYLLSITAENTLVVMDPDETLRYMGLLTGNAEEFSDYTSNSHKDPTVSMTEYGWLSSGYDPILNSAGEAIAVAGVDIDMTDVMNARHAFLWRMIGFSAVLALIAVLLGVLQMHRAAVRPLTMLSRATDEFAGDDQTLTKEKVIDLPITSKDEIGNLYQKTRQMQLRLVEYMDNLTRVTAEKERIGAELNVATQIQADMLPRIFPAFPDRKEFDIFASMTPAKEVGGDFYDFFLIDDDHIGMVMADVSGKGVPAALFMVIAKTLIKNRAMMGDSPADVLKNVNNQLCEGNEAELFVTVWLGIVEISTGKGVAVNAGHEHPVIRRAGGEYELVVYRHSPAVATFPGLKFRQHDFELHPGDTLFVYTDGVPEATSADQELFGPERMLKVLNDHPDATVEEMLPIMKNAIDTFVGDAPQFDDITMLAFDYKGLQAPKAPELPGLTLEATLENLNQVLAYVDGQLDLMDCSMKAQTQIDIAVEEMYVNIAHYAYGSAGGWANILAEPSPEDPNTIRITFRDAGVPYNPLAKEDPDVTLSAEERKIGGLGIYMVKKSMDNVYYEHTDDQNIFTMEKKCN